jgi:peptidyl-prolyl cis-trans isomerase SurA
LKVCHRVATIPGDDAGRGPGFALGSVLTNHDAAHGAAQAERVTGMLRGHYNTIASLTALMLAAGVSAASAQMNFPGVSVSMPPPTAPAQPPPVAAAPAAAKPVAKAAQPAKPKTKPVTTASADASVPDAKGGQAIIMLINDEPITAYEVDMRTRFLAMSSGGQAIAQSAQDSFKKLITSEGTNARFKAMVEQIIRDNQATKSRDQIMAMIEAKKKEFAMGLQKQAMDGARSAALPRFRKEAQEELIEEKLKMQEARKLGVVASDEEVDRVIKGIAEKNKVTPAQFAQNIKNMGSDISVMKARFQSGFSWREVVRRKFAAQISVNQRDVDKLMQQNTKPNEDTVELQIQKITLPLPAKLDQAALAQRLADSDALRRKFAGCKTTAALASSLPGAKFEDLKYIKPSGISEPARSFLTSAKDGEMLPPQTSSGGIDVYTVCARRELKVDDKKREEAQQELQSREFEQLAKRHLRDLRQDAHIELR